MAERSYDVPFWRCPHPEDRQRPIEGTTRAVCEDCGGFFEAKSTASLQSAAAVTSESDAATARPSRCIV